MSFLIVLLKCILVIGLNIGLGLLFCYLFKWFFFIPKPIMVFGKKLPLTPGLLHRKKKWLIAKLFSLVNDYLSFAAKEMDRNNYLARFEEKLFQQYKTAVSGFLVSSPLPRFIMSKIEKWLESLGRAIIKKILRHFIPWIIEQLDLNGKIELLNDKLDIYLIEKYFNRFVFKYMLLFTLVFWGMIGFYNMLIFLILI